ncbi:MAG: hypothetical protein U0136_07265 [Bdellovibrionota bacterium]
MDNLRLSGDFAPATSKSGTFIRLLGVCVLVLGLYSAWRVVERAWLLMEKPDAIATFSNEIEKQTHLNAFVGQMKIVVDFVNRAKNALPAVSEPAPPPQKPSAGSTPSEVDVVAAPLNASYFSAWIIYIVLLGLIARISLWAVGEGARLAVYQGEGNAQLKAVLQELLRETKAR